MTTITHRIEVIDHPGGEDDDGWTETNLYITISAKTAEEMKTENCSSSTAPAATTM